MSKIIVVKNNKGGVGKSWITLQLAYGLAVRSDKKVLILTSDNQNNILHYAGIKCEIGSGLEKWLKDGDGELVNVRENLYFIPMTSDYIKPGSVKRIEALMKRFRDEYEYILIDSTPTLNIDAELISLCDDIVIPTFLDEVTTASIFNFMDKVEMEKIKAIIPNRFTRTKKERGYYESIAEILSGTNILLARPVKQSGVIGSLIDSGKTIWDSGRKEVSEIQDIFIKVIEKLEA